VYRPADADVAGPAESTAAAMAELEEQLAHSLLLLAEGSSCAGPLYPVSLLGLAGGAAGALAAAAGGGIVVRGAPIPCIPFRVSDFFFSNRFRFAARGCATMPAAAAVSAGQRCRRRGTCRRGG
jgi:hypothetical protein